MVIKSCGMMPRAPLRFLGASSPRYMGTTLDERPAEKKKQLKTYYLKKINKNCTHSRLYEHYHSLTCTDANNKPCHNDDLKGLCDLTDPHHDSRYHGEDVVKEEGTFPEAEWMHFKANCTYIYIFFSVLR